MANFCAADQPDSLAERKEKLLRETRSILARVRKPHLGFRPGSSLAIPPASAVRAFVVVVMPAEP